MSSVAQSSARDNALCHILWPLLVCREKKYERILPHQAAAVGLTYPRAQAFTEQSIGCGSHRHLCAA